MKKLIGILVCLFFVAPAAHAETIEVPQVFILPSGLVHVATTTVEIAAAPTISPVRTKWSAGASKDGIVAYIEEMADQYGVSAYQLLKTAECESGLRTNVYGDKGKAYGLMQFWRGTFNLFKKEAGMSDFEYKNWRDQTELAAWMFSQNLKYHWSCARHLGFT